MKRIVVVILTLLLSFSLVSCGDSKTEGTWYSIPGEDMYKFEDGNISYSGQVVGQYEDNGKTIVISMISGADNLQLYSTRYKKFNVLSDTRDGNGNIYFCKGLENTQKLVQILEAAAEEAARFKVPDVEMVTYDSLETGKYAGKTVAAEAIVRSIEYVDYMDWYEMVLEFWSDKEQKYMYKMNNVDIEKTWYIDPDEHHPDAVAQAKTFNVGDKIKIIMDVYDDGSWGEFVWAEVIE